MKNFHEWHGVLEAYAVKWGHAVRVVNAEGIVLTCSAGGDPEEGFLQHLKGILHEDLTQLIWYQTEVGQSVCIMPIRGLFKLAAFLLVGPIDTQLPMKQTELIKTELEQFGTLLAGIINGQQIKSYRIKLLELVHQVQQNQLQKNNRWLTDYLRKFLKLGRIDLIGIAMQTEDKSYRITHVCGGGEEQLKNLSFQLGESFFGYAAAEGKPKYWHSIEQDPRSHFFERFNITISSLVCWPIQGESPGVFFVGSKKEMFVEQTEMYIGEMIARELGHHLRIDALEAGIQKRRMQIRTIAEICRTVSEADNLQQILYMLLDMSLYVSQGAFSCVVWFDAKKQGKAQVLSRGLSQTQSSELAKHIMRNRSAAEDIGDAKHPAQRIGLNGHAAVNGTAEINGTEEINGMQVTQIPLLFQHTYYGAVLIDHAGGDQEHDGHSFMNSLCVIASMALHQYSMKANGFFADIISILQEMLKAGDDQSKNKCLQVSEFLIGFATECSWREELIQHMTVAALTAGFSDEFMEKQLSPQLVEAMASFRSGEQGRLLQLAFDWFALDQGKREKMNAVEIESFFESLEDAKHIQDLVAFITKAKTVSLSVELVDTGRSRGSKNDPGSREYLYESVAQLGSLSKREQDVLVLIAQGRTNKEIADTLFISDHTVKNHITNVFRKLGVNDRAQAMAMLYQQKRNNQ